MFEQTEQTFLQWQNKCGEQKLVAASRFNQLESKNRRLKPQQD